MTSCFYRTTEITSRPQRDKFSLVKYRHEGKHLVQMDKWAETHMLWFIFLLLWRTWMVCLLLQVCVCCLIFFFFFADISNFTSLCFHLNDQRDLSLFVLQLMLEILDHPLWGWYSWELTWSSSRWWRRRSDPLTMPLSLVLAVFITVFEPVPDHFTSVWISGKVQGQTHKLMFYKLYDLKAKS